jgi:hypothetical protein
MYISTIGWELAGDAERSTFCFSTLHSVMPQWSVMPRRTISSDRGLCSTVDMQRRRYVDCHRWNGCCYRPSPENVLVCKLFSIARCSLGGAGCATLHRDQRLADRLRARGLVCGARCAALLRKTFSKLARLLNEAIVRNLSPSLSTAARKRWCTSTTLLFLLDGSFCLISHDFNRACSCVRASLEVSSSKTRKALRTRHIGSVLRSVSGSCSTQWQRFAKVAKGAGRAGCSTLPSAESREPGCSAVLVDTCAAPPGAEADCAAPLSGPHCGDCDIGGRADGSRAWRKV